MLKIISGLLTAMVFLLIASCGRNGQGFGDVQNAFPPLAEAPTAQPAVRVNLYIQATEDMQPLLSPDSQYANLLNILQNSAVELWGTHGVTQHVFRFDVEWLEVRGEAGYVRTTYHFAYPLDPVWWIRPDGVAPQIPQIFDAAFYRREWYLEQNLRAPGEYERRIREENPPFTNREQARISRTIEEITRLRAGQNEVSVMVTNFRGHMADGIQIEDADIIRVMLEYLQIHPESAIGVFAFENGSNPFYFILFGSTREVAALSNHIAFSIESGLILLT